MKTKKLYILTFLGIALVSALAGFGALHYFYRNAKDALMEQKIQAGQREIRELGILLEQRLEAGVTSDKVINELQRSIINTDVQSEFVCMYNTDGIELCHPNPSLVGMKIEENNSSFSENGNEQSFRELLKQGKHVSGIRIFPQRTNRNSEIVSVYPVKGTNWILASHTNIKASQIQLENLYQRFLMGSSFLVVILVVSCFWLIRLIYRRYEKEVDLKISGLNNEINNLSIINRQLEIKQKNTTDTLRSNEGNARKRLITYQKDEIITIDTADIVYMTLNEGVTSVLTFQDKTYTVNGSLDDLMKELDTAIFYRANRQYILNVNAIESIWIYGRNQLRIETKPKSVAPVIISKNKVSEFKKWLDR